VVLAQRGGSATRVSGTVLRMTKLCGTRGVPRYTPGGEKSASPSMESSLSLFFPQSFKFYTSRIRKKI